MRLTLAACALACAVWASAATAAPADPPRLMTYITGLSTPTPEVWRAATNGSLKTMLGPASSAQISPDGSEVAAINATRAQAGKTPSYSLTLYATNGTLQSPPTGHAILPTDQLLQLLGWSADSKLILVQVGTNPASLEVVDAATGRARTIARGIIDDGSFSPVRGSDQVVYARAQPGGAAVNIYTTSATGTNTRQLTHDGRSEYPLWCPFGIAFSQATPRRHNRYPELQLWLMKPDGSGARRLTDVAVKPGLEGLTPVACSAHNEHLLANFVGPPGANQTEAYVLDLSQRRPALRNLTGDANGYIGDAISRDGTSMLVTKGTADNLASLSIEQISWSGRARTIVPAGGYPSWDQ